jgi:hypothetical protein
MARAHETSRPYRTRPRTRTAEGVSDLVKSVLAITRRLSPSPSSEWSATAQAGVVYWLVGRAGIL